MNQFQVSKYPNFNMASHSTPAYLNNCHQPNMHNWLPTNSLQNEQPATTIQNPRLKVEDALSYLDQVKLQFGNQPHVYNDFLDIMKEFKSQTIDTPGVISRVSMLFRGHADLIVGFNTFLPPGYKIEVQANETIHVHQPGQQVVSLACLNTLYTHHNNANLYVSQTLAPPSRHIENSSTSSLNSVGSSQGQPVEFNHAITYVNKIKHNYHDRPDIYKRFLDILHNYQKEQMNVKEQGARGVAKMTITETEVYNQVSTLFEDQPELLQEFKQFLPDADGSYDQSLKVDKTVKNSTSSKHSNTGSPRRQPLVHSTQSTRINKRQTSLYLKENNYPDNTDSKHIDDTESTNITPRKLTNHAEKDHITFQHYMEAHRNEQISFKEFQRHVSSIIKKYPNLRHKVNQLKLQHQQMQQVAASKEANGLTVAADQVKEPIKVEDKEWILDVSSCEEYGRHYRILPSSYVPDKCSGRTDLCNSVLNDTHVLYASQLTDDELKEYDDPNYKRSIYEDHVFQCEDEKYELDMLIGVNESVMRALYRIQQRMQTMNNEDLNRYQIDDLSATFAISPVHIETAIRRLYGTRWGTIIEGLQQCPSVTVPLVHRCMKSKDIEWREVCNQMEKSWGDTMDRLYLKSLDLQASKFKQADVKLLRTKSLIKDLQTERNKDASILYSINLLSEMNQYEDMAHLVASCINRFLSITSEEQCHLAHVLQDVVPEILILPKVTGVVKVKEEVKDDYNEENLEQKSMVFSSILEYAEKTILKEDSNKIQFYCNEHWYVLLRLLILLCQRLTYFKKKCQDLIVEDEGFKASRCFRTAQVIKLRNPDTHDPNNAYNIFLELVRNFATNGIDNISFEDKLREIFGMPAYIGFTIDKLLQTVVKMIQHILSKDESLSIQQLFEENKLNISPINTSSLQDENIFNDSYYLKAKHLLNDKSLFKVVCEKTHSSHIVSFEIQEVYSRDLSRASTPQATPIKESNDIYLRDSNSEICGRRKRKMQTQGFREAKKLKTTDGVVLVSGIIPDFCRKFKKRLPTQLTTSWPPNTNASILQTLEDLALLHQQVIQSNGFENESQSVDQERIFCFYRNGALSSARKTHRMVCLHRLRRYKVLLERWRRKQNINPNFNFLDWNQLNCSNNSSQLKNTIRTIVNDTGFKSPYRPYCKYKVMEA